MWKVLTGAKSQGWCFILTLTMNPIAPGGRSRSHLSRAQWMTEHGYRHLLRGGASAYIAGLERLSEGGRMAGVPEG